MFDKFTRKVAEKMGHSVRNTIQPIQTEVKKTVDNKVDLYSKILRLGVLILLFIEGTKTVADTSKGPQGPGQIIINNYITRKDDEN